MKLFWGLLLSGFLIGNASGQNPFSILGKAVTTSMDARTKSEVTADAEIGAGASKRLLDNKKAEWAGVTVLVFAQHAVIAGAVKSAEVKKLVEEIVKRDPKLRSTRNELLVGDIGSLARDTALEAEINAKLTAAKGVSSVNMQLSYQTAFSPRSLRSSASAVTSGTPYSSAVAATRRSAGSPWRNASDCARTAISGVIGRVRMWRAWSRSLMKAAGSPRASILPLAASIAISHRQMSLQARLRDSVPSARACFARRERRLGSRASNTMTWVSRVINALRPRFPSAFS